MATRTFSRVASEAGIGIARCRAGPRGRCLGVNAMDVLAPKTIGFLLVQIYRRLGVRSGPSSFAVFARESGAIPDCVALGGSL